MITKHDLDEAIAECQGERNPNANTCIKLAAYLTIKENLFSKEIPVYSYATAPDATENEDYFSKSEFSQAVQEKGIRNTFPIIDELMDTLLYINPKLYNSVLRKLRDA